MVQNLSESSKKWQLFSFNLAKIAPRRSKGLFVSTIKLLNETLLLVRISLKLYGQLPQTGLIISSMKLENLTHLQT